MKPIPLLVVLQSTTVKSFSVMSSGWRVSIRCQNVIRVRSPAFLFLQDERSHDVVEEVAEHDPEWYREFVLNVLGEDLIRADHRLSASNDLFPKLNPDVERTRGTAYDCSERSVPESSVHGHHLESSTWSRDRHEQSDEVSHRDLINLAVQEKRGNATQLEIQSQTSDTLDDLVFRESDAIAKVRLVDATMSDTTADLRLHNRTSKELAVLALSKATAFERWKILNETNSGKGFASSRKIAEVEGKRDVHGVDNLSEESKARPMKASANKGPKTIGPPEELKAVPFAGIEGKTSQGKLESGEFIYNLDIDEVAYVQNARDATISKSGSGVSMWKSPSQAVGLEQDVQDRLPLVDNNATECFEVGPAKDAYVVLYRDIYTGELRADNLTTVTALGYNASEIRYLQPDALALILKDEIRKPIHGTPQQWQISQSQYEFLSDDIRIVPQELARELQEAANGNKSSFTTNGKELTRSNKESIDAKGTIRDRDHVFDGKKGTLQRRTPRKSEAQEGFTTLQRRKGTRRGRLVDMTDSQAGRGRPTERRKRMYNARKEPKKSDRAEDGDPPPPNNPLWVDMGTFRDLLRSEAELRVRILGEDWADVVKDESRWRLSLYKEWLWALKRGIGNPLIPSRSDRTRARWSTISEVTSDASRGNSHQNRLEDRTSLRKISNDGVTEIDMRGSSAAARRKEGVEDDTSNTISRRPKKRNTTLRQNSATSRRGSKERYSDRPPRRARQTQPRKGFGRKRDESDIDGPELELSR